MNAKRALFITALAAAGTPLVAATPASAASSLNLRPGVNVLVPWPDAGTWWFQYDASVSAQRRVRVFDPATRRWQVEDVPSSANGVVVRTVLPPELSIVGVDATNGFACGRIANVVTCTGNVPQTGTAKAVTISALPPALSTPYWVSATVDPANGVAETVETDNTVWCGASAFSAKC